MAYPGLYRLQNFVVQQMELWYFEWLDLGGFGKKHLRTQHEVRLFHWRLPNRAQLAAKRQPRETPRDAQTPFSICTWIRGLAALAPWNRLKIYKSHLRNLANTPPFVEVQPNLQKKGSMLYRCQQIHLIYKQTIQTSIQQIDWLFWSFFQVAWPSFQNLSIKSIFAANPNLGIPWGIPAFCHMEDPANAAKSSPGVPGPVWNEQVRHDGWSGHEWVIFLRI